MAGQDRNPNRPIRLPELLGRVGVLGGTDQDKTNLCVALARQQVQHHRPVVCVDARRYKTTEIQFRLLIRENARYIPLASPARLPQEIPHSVLAVVGQGLQQGQTDTPPPLILIDGLDAGDSWERTLAFVLRAGATVVSFLGSATEAAFGRYDTLLVLRAQAEAEAVSRAVGRKVSPEEIVSLPSDQAWLIHLTQVYRVRLPQTVTDGE